MSGQARDEAGKTHFRPVGRAPVLSDRIPERCWAAADFSACGVAMTRCKTVCAPPSRSAVFLCVLCGLRSSERSLTAEFAENGRRGRGVWVGVSYAQLAIAGINLGVGVEGRGRPSLRRSDLAPPTHFSRKADSSACATLGVGMTMQEGLRPLSREPSLPTIVCFPRRSTLSRLCIQICVLGI